MLVLVDWFQCSATRSIADATASSGTLSIVASLLHDHCNYYAFSHVKL